MDSFQSKPVGIFAKFIPQCSDGLQCPLPEDHSIPTSYNNSPKQFELGKKDRYVPVSTELSPLRKSLMQIEMVSLFVYDQKTYVFKISKLVPMKPPL